MFFLIGPDRDPRFENSYYLNSTAWLNTDAGWHEVWTTAGSVHFKGYCLEHPLQQTLAQALLEDPTPRFAGNFAAIISHRSGSVTVTHDRDRAFPLIWDPERRQLGNIGTQDGCNIWADAVATVDPQADVVEHRWDPGRAVGTPLSMSAAVDTLFARLTQTFSYLKHYDRGPIRLFFSGGIDTLTCLALLRYLDIPHDMVWAEHFEYDRFTTSFVPQFRRDARYWGYQQIHHWRQPGMLVTGGCGDEMFMRGPATVNMMLMHLGMEMSDLLQPTDYHWDYFQQAKNQKIYQSQQSDTVLLQDLQSPAGTHARIIDTMLNDHQHWHLGHTLTFTPFKDLEILRTVLRLDSQDLQRQMANAELQREIIQRCDPALLAYLSPRKNDSMTLVWKMYQDLI